MKDQILAENHLEDSYYKLPRFNKKRSILLLTSIFLLGFILNFPATRKIENTLRSTLSSIPGCRLQFNDLKIGYLLPKVTLQKLKIPGQCINQAQAIELDTVNINFRGPSFSPLGLALSVNTIIKGQELTFYVSTNGLEQNIKIDQQKIQLSALQTILPKVKLLGEVEINGLAKVSQNVLKDMNLLIESKNLSIPPQEIEGFMTPALNPKNFILKLATGKEDSNQVNVQEFVIGDPQSSLRAKMNGKIILNTKNIQFSRLDLTGEFALGEKIISEIPILPDMLTMFARKDNFYQIKLLGTIGQPSLKSL